MDFDGDDTDERTDYGPSERTAYRGAPRRRGVQEGRRMRRSSDENVLSKAPVLWLEIEQLERATSLLQESIDVLSNKIEAVMSPEMTEGDSMASPKESRDDYGKLALSMRNQTERLHYLRRRVEELNERVQL